MTIPARPEPTTPGLDVFKTLDLDALELLEFKRQAQQKCQNSSYGIELQHPQPIRRASLPFAHENRPSFPRRKRQQVKNACVNCQKACKKCDDQRPCSRCVKYGINDSCADSARKERKRGTKRGPYRRRDDTEAYSSSPDVPFVMTPAATPMSTHSLPSIPLALLKTPHFLSPIPMLLTPLSRGTKQSTNEQGQ